MSIVIDILKAWEPLIVLMSLGSAFLLIIASKFNLAFQSPIHTVFWVQWEFEHFDETLRQFTLCDQICQKKENVDLKVYIDSNTYHGFIFCSIPNQNLAGEPEFVVCIRA